MRRGTVLFVVVKLWVVSFVAATAADIDEQRVKSAIQRGAAYLLREQSPQGTWAEYTGQPGGVTSLCTLALLTAGVAPADPELQKALVALRRLEPDRTYALALQTMAFCAAEPKKDLVLIRRDVKLLQKMQIKNDDNRGSWSYPGASGDNSNTQFAILALHEAEVAGVEVSDATWRLADDYFRRTQNKDGSWGYTPGRSGTGSMTCAGIAALVITAEKISRGDAAVVDQRVQCCGQQEDDAALERALAWMGRHFSVERNPGDPQHVLYYLYGVERVGRMTAQRFLGDHDWYREGVEKLLDDQDTLSGFWQGFGHGEDNRHVSTSLALLFLSKGRRPVVAAKLKHGPAEDWNHHRSDLAHLTAHTERLWHKHLTWQVIDPRAASVSDLLEAPVLYLSGRQGLELSPREKQNLRGYIDGGGFLFAEACCEGDGFDSAFRALMEEIFPEPEYRLRLIPPEHPIWRAEQRVPPDHLKPLYGIDYGCRTCVVYCPDDLSCFWELSRGERGAAWPPNVQQQVDAALAIGVNVLTYATGREPRYKEAMFGPAESELQTIDLERGTFAVAKLVHQGGCNAAPGALANLLRTARSELDLRIDVRDHSLALTDPQLFRFHLAFMHGRHQFHLAPAERQHLATYLQRGGTLMVDAICASQTFADSFRAEMKAIFPDNPLARIPVTHPLFTDQFGGYDIRSVMRRDPEPSAADQPLRAQLRKVEPLLEGIRLEDRYAVIFSPYDISCALEKHDSLECHGYTREDAARIALNVLLYSLHP